MAQEIAGQVEGIEAKLLGVNMIADYKPPKYTRTRPCDFKCNKKVVGVTYMSNGEEVSSVQIASIADEIMRIALSIEEDGDFLRVKLVESPEYIYWRRDFDAI